MPKTKNTKIEETSQAAAPTAPTAPTAPVGLASNTLWIGSKAMQRIKEQLDESEYGMYSETEEDKVDAGARHIEEFLHEFQSMTGLRLRLILGDAEAPFHELDISKLSNSQGSLANDDIQKWVKAGAALIADYHDETES